MERIKKNEIMKKRRDEKGRKGVEMRNYVKGKNAMKQNR